MSFGDDFINTLPKLIIDFWYLLIVFIGLIFLMNKFYPKVPTLKNQSPNRSQNFIQSLSGKILLFIVFFALTFIGFRGGIQYKPLNILSASKYGTGKITPLVLNTSFTIIKTYGKQTIEELHWMSKEEAQRINPVIKIPSDTSEFIPRNIVLIVLEGIGKEYIGSLNSYPGYTPFLDSLIDQGLVFTNSFANGKRSIEGIPAIIAGIPGLMTDPFITSAYSSNSITTMPSLLKSKGYYSIFFHGGTNGTMGFDNFSKLSGFDRYFGRYEYNNDSDYDGTWGIYDEEFLQRSLKEISAINSPFFATIFTLSSHHPYTIPERYNNRFPAGTLPIHQSIGYTDYSLKLFFKNASSRPWFNNTLFVITSDHTSLSEIPFYQNRVGIYSIPVIYYSPVDTLLRGKKMNATQQIDILPSIMDYINYDRPYFAFGNSAFDDKGNGMAINFIDETYQLIQDDYTLIMGSNEKNALYNFVTDSLMKHDLNEIDKVREKNMELKLKSFLQNFNHAIIHNEMK